MPLINKIPTISSGDYKNYNAYFDETPGRAAVQYVLKPKMVISDTEGVFRTMLGDLSRDEPYADFTSVYVNTFIDYTFKKNPAYNTKQGNIKVKNGGTMIIQTPQGENNPMYKSQPTFLMAFPGRDTLALNPHTKMLTNTKVVTQGGLAVDKTANNAPNNTPTPTPSPSSTSMGSSSSMGVGGGMGSVGGGY